MIGFIFKSVILIIRIVWQRMATINIHPFKSLYITAICMLELMKSYLQPKPL